MRFVYHRTVCAGLFALRMIFLCAQYRNANAVYSTTTTLPVDRCHMRAVDLFCVVIVFRAFDLVFIDSPVVTACESQEPFEEQRRMICHTKSIPKIDATQTRTHTHTHIQNECASSAIGDYFYDSDDLVCSSLVAPFKMHLHVLLYFRVHTTYPSDKKRKRKHWRLSVKTLGA